MCYPKLMENEEIVAKFTITELPEVFMGEEEDEDLLDEEISEDLLGIADDILGLLSNMITSLLDMIEWFNKMKEIVNSMALSKSVLKFINKLNDRLEVADLKFKCSQIYQEMRRIEEVYENSIIDFIDICYKDLQTLTQRKGLITYEINYGSDQSLFDKLNTYFDEYKEFRYYKLFEKVWTVNADFIKHCRDNRELFARVLD